MDLIYLLVCKIFYCKQHKKKARLTVELGDYKDAVHTVKGRK